MPRVGNGGRESEEVMDEMLTCADNDMTWNRLSTLVWVRRIPQDRKMVVGKLHKLSKPLAFYFRLFFPKNGSTDGGCVPLVVLT